MKLLGASNGRSFYHVDGRMPSAWEATLPMTNWLALPILEQPDQVLAQRIARACLDKDVTYVCALGKAHEVVHLSFDLAIVDDRINAGLSVSSQDDFEHSPMTTGHDDFDEGVWFALRVARDDHKEINAVVCIDMSEHGHAERLISLIEAINDGWSPSDNDQP